MEWLVDNAALVANLASLATLVVWTFYMVLFYRDFHRQRTPFLVIHQAQGSGLDSTSLVVNLSKEPVHVVCVMFALHTTRGTFLQRLQNFRRVSRQSDTGRDVQTAIKQGPLMSGSFLGLGSFVAVLEAAVEGGIGGIDIREAGGREQALHKVIRDLREIEIRVIALHGAHGRPIGASRRFRVHVEDGDQVTIEPTSLLARQLSSRAKSRIVREWFRDCNPNLGSGEP